MATPPATLTLSIPNRIEALAAGMDEAEAFLAAWSVDPGDGAQVMIMLDEVASNVIKNAWPGGGEHSFTVELRMLPDGAWAGGGLGFELLATDDGTAFDPTQAAPPDLELSLDDREPGGLGLFMVGEMSDRMEYSRAEGCNRLLVAKVLQRVEQPA